jgi:hypothetical protein
MILFTNFKKTTADMMWEELAHDLDFWYPMRVCRDVEASLDDNLTLKEADHD